jgi:hypothetical protein
MESPEVNRCQQLPMAAVANQIQRVVVLNNQGAQYLMSGSPLESIRRIRPAMQILRSFHQGERDVHYEEEPTLQLPTQLSMATAAPAAWTSFRWSAVAMNDRDMAEENDYGPMLQNEIYFIYSRPIVLPAWWTLTSSGNLNCLARACSVYLIFNLALACHYFVQGLFEAFQQLSCRSESSWCHGWCVVAVSCAQQSRLSAFWFLRVQRMRTLLARYGPSHITDRMPGR